MEKILVFSINKNQYCIDIENIQEIAIIKNHISRVPNQKEFYDGLTLLRDRTIQVINTWKFLGLEEVKNENEQKEDYLIILSEREGFLKGLRINNVNKILDVSELSIKDFKFGKDNSFNQVVVDEKNNDIFVLLNPDVFYKTENLEEIDIAESSQIDINTIQ